MPDDVAPANAAAPPAPPAPTSPADAPAVPASSAPPVPADWRQAHLPEELRRERTFEKFADVSALAKSYHELEVAHRQKSPPPAPDEVVPDKAEYKPTLPDLGEGAPPWDQARLAAAYKVLHEARATPKVVQAAVNMYGQMMIEDRQRFTEQLAQHDAEEIRKGVEALEQLWGPRGQPRWATYEQRARDAARVLMTRGGAAQDEIDAVDALAVKYPRLLHGFAVAAEGLIESKYMQPSATPGRSLDDVRARLNEIDADPMYRRGHMDDPRHAQLVAERLRLQEQLTPGPARGYERRTR